MANRFQKKTFIANNTLNSTVYRPIRAPKEEIKKRYGITSLKNIICMGRMQRRKRVENVIKALFMLELEDAGLVLVRSDDFAILEHINEKRTKNLRPIYGEDSLDLLSAPDVYCLPGSNGLSIVEAFCCGLPVVMENVVHGPEIIYLKNGLNGYNVTEGNTME